MDGNQLIEPVEYLVNPVRYYASSKAALGRGGPFGAVVNKIDKS